MSKIGSTVDQAIAGAKNLAESAKNKAEDIGGRIVGDIELLTQGPIYKINDYDVAVSPGLWRGSRLEPGEMQKLKDAGFKGFVDLRAEAPGADPAKSNENAFEKKLAEAGDFLAKHGIITPTQADVAEAKKVGLNALNVPIVDNTPPTVQQMVDFLKFATNKDNRPVYVHCEAGKGRTGVAVAVYRMAVQGWTADEAMADGIEHGLGLEDQEAFIRQFYDQLQHGKIAGFPLNPPEPSVKPTAPKGAWVSEVPVPPTTATDGMAPSSGANAAAMLGSTTPDRPLTAMETAKLKARNALIAIEGLPSDIWNGILRQVSFLQGKTSPNGVVKHIQSMSQAELAKLSDAQLARLATFLTDKKTLDNLPFFGANREDMGNALVRVLTAKVANPNGPLSPTDQGHIDAILSRLPPSRDSLLSRVVGPAHQQVQRLLQHPVTAGDWAGFQSYVNAESNTVQRPGTLIEPLIDGGLVPQTGRPPIPTRVVPPGTKMVVEDPNGAFPTIFRAIDAAKAGDPVYVSEFAIQSDDTGRQLIQHLEAAKARGCDVRVIYDPQGSKASNGGVTDARVYDDMRAKGIPVIPFPDGTADDHLTHRKIIVAGKTGFIGGMNIGDEYSAIWHDTHSRVTGPGVGDLMSLFTTQWNDALVTTLTNKVALTAAQQKHTLAKLGNPQPFSGTFAQDFAKTLSPVAGAPEGAQAARIVGHVGDADQDLKMVYLRAIATAKDRIYLKSPYASDPDIQRALAAAAKRGVKVVAMFPATNDVKIEQNAARGWYPDLVAAGVQVYEYKGRSMDHGKVAVFDDVSTIGSSNVDRRSLHFNDEANEWSSDPKGAEALVQNLFLKDMQPAHANHMTADVLLKWTPAERELYELARQKMVEQLI